MHGLFCQQLLWISSPACLPVYLPDIMSHSMLVRDTLYTIGHKHILVQMTKMPLECTSNLLVDTIQSILINTEDCSESSIEERAHAGGAC